MTFTQVEPKKIYIWSTEIKKVYLWSTQIRPAGWWWWQPWANTLAYYPLTAQDTTSDKSWNGHTLTKYGSWTTTFWTYSGISCLYIADDAMFYSTIPNTDASSGITQSIWYYQAYAPQNDNWWLQTFNANSPTSDTPRYISSSIMNWLWSRNWFTWWASNGVDSYTSTASVTSGWHNVITTFSWTTITLYVDWNEIGTSSKNLSYYTQTYISISRRTSNYNRSLRGYVSNAIFENKARTAQEVSDYYDQTKGDYWISSLQSIAPNISPDVIPDTPNNWTWDVLTI